jgi:hypothetical protein
MTSFHRPLVSLTGLAWLFTGGVFIHNLEECVWLPAWSLRRIAGWRPMGTRECRFAAVALSAIMLLVTVTGTHAQPHSPAALAMAGYVCAMLLNVLIPHVYMSLRGRTYMPGTATALLLNLPLGYWYLHRAIMGQRINPVALVWSGPLVGLVLLSLVHLSLRLARLYTGPDW